jgi:hypothetical protein
LKAFLTQHTYETQDETLEEGAFYTVWLSVMRPSGQDQMISSEQGNQSQEEPGQKRSRTVKSEVIPEDKSLVNVLYICEANNCDYNCEYPN